MKYYIIHYLIKKSVWIQFVMYLSYPLQVCPLLYTTRISTAKLLIELEMLDEATQVLEGLLDEDDQVSDKQAGQRFRGKKLNLRGLPKSLYGH